MKVITDNKYYQDIANAIRIKLGTDKLYSPSEMAGAIMEIPTSASFKGRYRINNTGDYITEPRIIDNIGTSTPYIDDLGLDETQDFTIQMKVKINNPDNHKVLMSLYRMNGWESSPITLLHVLSSNIIEADFYRGSTKSLSGPNDRINEWLYVKLIKSSSNWTVETYDSNKVLIGNKSSSIASLTLYSDTNRLVFGLFSKNTGSFKSTNVSLDLNETYVENNGVVIFGIK